MFCLIFWSFILLIDILVDCDTKVNSNENTFKSIGETNLRTGINYYIKEKSGKYLRWDGNHDFHRSGLYFDSQLRDDYRKDWYLFALENRGYTAI
jgi:Na+-transporting NADH:ubiquinone oxidoreductase subunit NqrF